MKVDLTNADIDIIMVALRDRVDALSKHKEWLHTGDGQRLACAYTAIGQIEQEIASTRETWLKLIWLHRGEEIAS